MRNLEGSNLFHQRSSILFSDASFEAGALPEYSDIR